MTTSPEELEKLLALQSVDSTLLRLRHQLDSLEVQQQLDASNQHLGTLQAAHDDVVVERDRVGAQQRQLERELDILIERRDAELSRLYDGTVANERQMRSVEAEVETTKRRITEHEELLMQTLEQVDALDTREQQLNIALAAEKEQVAALTKQRDEAAAAILAELAEQEVARDAHAKSVDEELLRSYETIAQRTGGVAIGKLEGQACSACRIEMPMARINDLLAGPSLTTCPQCQRLLVIPD